MIIFRADGNKTIGWGHVMRCLSVADAFKSSGKEVAFICGGDEMYDLISSRGYRCEVLGTAYRDMDSETDALLKNDLFKKAEVIIVDSYFVTEEYIRFLNEYVKTVYIDDYVSKLPVNVLVNYNIYADREEYEKVYGHSDTTFLLGTDYVPLRKEYTDGHHISVKDKAENVLILSGGSDPLHVAYKIAKEISILEDLDLKYHFVMGSMSGDREKMEELGAKRDFINVYFDLREMKSLMLKCDMALSASGTTLYELCSCGIPTINFITADNQKKGACAFCDKGIMLSLGDVCESDDFAKKAVAAIKDLSGNKEKRKALSLAGCNLIKGNGAENLARKIEELIL